MKVKEESEKVGLKLNIQKTNIMASGPITSWQIDGETATDFIFLDSKITADGDFNHEIQRHFLLGRKVMANLITHLEPDIMECKIKWAFRKHHYEQLVEVMEFQLSYFKS